MDIETLEMEGPRPDEVLVRLVASGVCHTDIDMWEDGASGPVVLGHEGAGIVEQAGSMVQGVALGDHVVLSYQSCGMCPECLSDNPAHCLSFWEANFGFARLDGSNALAVSGVRGHFFGQSSFASHALATARNMVKVDKNLDLALLAPLGCGLQTGAGTVLNSLAVKPGQSLLILGSGTVGLAAVMAGRLAGADPIIAVDLFPHRLSLARELGATHAIDNREDDLAKRISGISGRGIDHILEITGQPDLYRLTLELLAPGGSAALLTGQQGPGKISRNRWVSGVIQGDAVPQKFIPEMINHYQAGRFPFDRLVSYFPFRDINQAMAASKRGEAIKPVLRMEV